MLKQTIMFKKMAGKKLFFFCLLHPRNNRQPLCCVGTTVAINPHLDFVVKYSSSISLLALFC